MKNWKTTLIGSLTAIANAILPMLTTGNFDSLQPKDLAVSAGIAAIGWFAKDAGVTGTEK